MASLDVEKAICFLENLLEKHNTDLVIETIRQYKADKNLPNNELLETINA